MLSKLNVLYILYWFCLEVSVDKSNFAFNIGSLTSENRQSKQASAFISHLIFWITSPRLTWEPIKNYLYIDGSRAVVVWILAKVLKNVNVTTIMFLMSGDLTGLCLYIHPSEYYMYKIVRNLQAYWNTIPLHLYSDFFPNQDPISHVD